MNRFMLSGVVMATLPFALGAQNTGSAFQYVITSGDGTRAVTMVKQKTKTVTGKPLIGSEEHHTLQTLGDGTRIEGKSTDKFYRDVQGRTRTEREDGTVLINDSVQGSSVEFNANYSRRSAATAPPAGNTNTFSFTATDVARVDKIDAELLATKVRLDQVISGAVRQGTAIAVAKKQTEQTTEEDLGFQMVNGVSAQGTRTTLTIPVGQIGNDRAIQTVTERWFSPDLQMLIKSTTKDPRFGETTYELTNISQAVPDPSLFVVPTKSNQQ